eukprot:g1037.t1
MDRIPPTPDTPPPTELVVVAFEDIKIQSKIGAGGSGQVFKATYKKKTVALKQLFSQLVDHNCLDDFKQECKYLVTLNEANHPGIVGFLGVTIDYTNKRAYIILEYCPNCVAKMLFDVQSGTRLLREKSQTLYELMETLQIIHDIANTMRFLHSAGIVHRDIKPENLLIDKCGRVKLCDFGLARNIESRRVRVTGGIGTVAYTPPELLESEKDVSLLVDGVKVDVYAFGIVLWGLIFRQKPYAGMSEDELVDAVLHENLRPPLPYSEEELLATPFLRERRKRMFKTQSSSFLDSFLSSSGTSLELDNETFDDAAAEDDTLVGATKVDVRGRFSPPPPSHEVCQPPSEIKDRKTGISRGACPLELAALCRACWDSNRRVRPHFQDIFIEILRFMSSTGLEMWGGRRRRGIRLSRRATPPGMRGMRLRMSSRIQEKYRQWASLHRSKLAASVQKTLPPVPPKSLKNVMTMPDIPPKGDIHCIETDIPVRSHTDSPRSRRRYSPGKAYLKKVLEAPPLAEPPRCPVDAPPPSSVVEEDGDFYRSLIRCESVADLDAGGSTRRTISSNDGRSSSSSTTTGDGGAMLATPIVLEEKKASAKSIFSQALTEAKRRRHSRRKSQENRTGD